ncbi:MAG TPA: translin family protein [Thermoplasmata archaeon]|nr:translin family protein [Thermoplasmata archaeon]
MKNLEKIVSKIESELDEKDEVREVALKSSRAVIRISGSILRGLHRKEDVSEQFKELKDEVSRLSGLLVDHPDIAVAGYVETAYQEYAEVGIMISLLNEEDVPSPEELGIGNVPFLLGLADTVGELRRACLDELKSGKVEKANGFLDKMEDIFSELMRFDYPEAILPIKRKQDVARSLLEKTRGEVAVAASTRNLHARLEEILKKK